MKKVIILASLFVSAIFLTIYISKKNESDLVYDYSKKRIEDYNRWVAELNDIENLVKTQFIGNDGKFRIDTNSVIKFTPYATTKPIKSIVDTVQKVAGKISRVSCKMIDYSTKWSENSCQLQGMSGSVDIVIITQLRAMKVVEYKSNLEGFVNRTNAYGLVIQSKSIMIGNVYECPDKGYKKDDSMDKFWIDNYDLIHKVNIDELPAIKSWNNEKYKPLILKRVPSYSILDDEFGLKLIIKEKPEILKKSRKQVRREIFCFE